jgi:UDP-N-acetyl-D-mannosaminuronate dehydrogenase
LEDNLTRLTSLDKSALAIADAVVVVTDHDDVDYQWVADCSDYVFDTRRRVPDGDSVERL